MHEENMDMDKKLKQLEQQSLPDLSRQDEHWKKMQSLMEQHPAPATSTLTSKRLWWLVMAAGLFLLVWIGNRYFSSTTPGADAIMADTGSNKTDTSGKDTIRLYARRVETSKDSIKLISLTAIRVKDSLIFKTPLLPKQTIPVSVTLKGMDNVIPQKAIRVRNSNNKDTVVYVSPVPADTTPATPGMTLAQFFEQLRKPEQHFSINNERDTLLQGIDGTALFIPAGTFDSKERVQLTLTEYYSYTDIITHQLSTCSNGAPLVTGGMIHLTASSNGKEVNIRPSKAIRWFVPDTAASLSQMQLFKGVSNSNQARLELFREDGDTLTGVNNQSMINWLPQPVYFTNTYFTTSVKVLDLRNEPYQSRNSRLGMIGKFYIDPKSNLSAEELRKEMKDRFGYHRVVIRKQRDNYGFLYKLTPRFLRRTSERNSTQPLGDSAWVDPSVAKTYRLTSTDTLISRGTTVGMNYQGIRMASRIKGVDTLLNNANLSSLAKRYSVDIRELGWINCDRFYRENGPRIDYIVNLGDTASNYFTLLVFEDIRSMINGTVAGNQVRFNQMPLGKKARLITVGIREGKPVTAMMPVTIDRQVLTGLKFEETSAPAFKEQVATLDR